ncbi:MAG: ATPase [Dehalococcoidia bacterium]|nr:ATPase [Dehalococcoidia bacterium]
MLIDASSMATLGAGVALAGGLAGSSLGLAIAAAAGAATLGQDSRQLRNVIIMAALPMSRAFYAFIFLILVITTTLPTIQAMADPAGSGFAVFGIGIMASLAFGVSGAYQGSVCAAGIAGLAKTDGKILTNGIMLAVFVELLAVLGLVFSIMALSILWLM